MKSEVIFEDLDYLIEQFREGKAKELFACDEVYVYVVDSLHEETNIPKVLIRWILSALQFLADKGIKVVGKKYLEKLHFFLARSPKILKLLSVINENLAQKAEKRSILEYITNNGSKPLSTENADEVSQILLEIYEENKSIVGEVRGSAELILEALDTYLLVKPELQIKRIKNNEGFSRFKYISDFIPFLGREKEFDFLDKFVAQDANFSWQVVYGSGGMGKSRLAIEYCRSLPQYWEKGFFYPSKMDEFENWIPSYSTFIVIDNAGTRIEFVNELLEYLSSRSEEFLCPVRVLLLERDMSLPRNWYEDFLLGGEHGNLEDYRYTEPYHLQTLSKRPLAQIANTFCRSLGSDKKTLKRLESYDKEKRPLYAAIMGALLEHGMEGKGDLMGPFIKDMHERYWEKENIDEEHYALIALATIVERLDFDTVESDLFPNDDELHEDWLALVLGEVDEQSIYSGISPHIIGEMFVLEYLKTNTFIINKLGSTKFKERKRDNFIEYCWRNNSREMAAFSLRCLMDFEDHASTELLCPDEILIGLNYEEDLYLDKFPAYLMHLTYSLKSSEKVKERLLVLKQAVEEKDTPGLTQVYIKACAQLLVDYSRTGEFLWAEDLYNDTLSLKVDRWPGGGVFTLMGSYTLVCIEVEKYQEAQSVFKKLEGLLCNKVSFEQYDSFLRLYDLLYLSNEDASSDSVPYVLEVHEKLQQVTEEIGRIEFQISFLKTTSNLLGFLLGHNQKDVAQKIWNIAIKTTYDSKEAELHEIGATIAYNAITIFSDESPMNFYTSGSLIRTFYSVTPTAEIFIMLVEWLVAYIKDMKDIIKMKSEMGFYEKIKEVPLSPENVEKIFELYKVEMENLTEICEVGNELNSDMELITYLPGGRTIEELEDR